MRLIRAPKILISDFFMTSPPFFCSTFLVYGNIITSCFRLFMRKILTTMPKIRCAKSQLVRALHEKNRGIIGLHRSIFIFNARDFWESNYT